MSADKETDKEEEKKASDPEKEAEASSEAKPELPLFPRRPKWKKFLPVGICVLVLVSVFLSYRYGKQQKLRIMLVSNASYDQVKGVEELLRNPGRYPSSWSAMVLDRLDFGGLIFTNLEFTNCDFSGSRFDAAVFDNCVFKDCLFKTCDMREAEFRNSSFEGGNFSRAVLSGATFENTSVKFANFKGARIDTDQIKSAEGWETASFDEEVAEALGL